MAELGYSNADEARSRANIPTSVSDASIELTLSGIEALVRRWLGFDPVSQSAQKIFNGTGTPLLVLDTGPLTAVSALYENASGYGQASAFTSDTLLTLGTDYILEQPGSSDAPTLRRVNSVWPYVSDSEPGRLAGFYAPCPGCVRVTYTAGLTGQDMDAIAEAVYLELAARFQSRTGGVGPVQSEGLDGYNYSRMTPNSGQAIVSPFVSQLAAQTLRQYRRTPRSQ